MRTLRPLILKILCVTAVLLLLSCQRTVTASSDSAAAINNTVKTTPAEGLANLTVRMFEYTSSGEANSLVSPASFAIALAMTGNGAKGTTLDEFTKLLGGNLPDINSYYESIISRSESSDNVTYNLANAIFVSDRLPVYMDYKKNLSGYKAEVSNLDFNSAKSVGTINGWVAKSTNSLIREIINQLSPDDRMVLLNTIYFKAKWQFQFDTNRTKDAEFTTSNGAKIITPFMNLSGNFTLSSDNKSDLLMLPYKGGRFEMGLLLPKENNLTGFIQALDAKYLENAYNNGIKTYAVLSVPKFEVNGSYNLNEMAKQLGISKAFAQDADFSGISSVKPLFISQIIQKTKITVTEEGTEAAAATAITMMTTSFVKDRTVLQFNRPFLFFIWDKTLNMPVFIGRLESPGQ